MRTTRPSLSLNLSFKAPSSTFLASPATPTALTLPSTTFTPSPSQRQQQQQPPVSLSIPSYTSSITSSPTAASPTTFNTLANQRLTLASYTPSSSIATTTLTYIPPPAYSYSRSQDSPKSILKRRESSSTDSISSVSSPPGSGRSIRFLDEPEVRTFEPANETPAPAPQKMSREERRWSRFTAAHASDSPEDIRATVEEGWR